VKRAEKDAAKEEAKGKGKRSRKRRSATPEADTATPVKMTSIRVTRMTEALLPESARASMVQMTATRTAEDDVVPGPRRAPVARMY
jgi:hypothetical protein